MNKLLFILLLTLPLFAQYKYTNALIKEESPYLIQHAHNPINWYAWNENSLTLAKKQNKLIFLSIGYSTCHWCHVMNEESFENEELAKVINKNYIAIKVDKEEMPHIDTKYQEILKKVSKRRNGWPLNVILTPSLNLVYITTYIPPTFKYGVEGMNTLIPRIAKRYAQKDKQLFNEIETYAQKIALKEENKIITTNLSDDFLTQMQKRYDDIYAGFDKQPKFPLATHLNVIHDIAQLTNNKKAFEMVYDSLKAMVNGGIFDQIEGGFYRYSVYADWVIPHFEKMLYTQAELIPLYVKAYHHTKSPHFKKAIIQTIKLTNKLFRNQEKLYYSASDADSLDKDNEKKEGFYYTYNYKEASHALKKAKIKNSKQLLDYLGIEKSGNFEEQRSNPYISYPEKKTPKNLHKARLVLKTIREKKDKPFIDKKVITSWNALMIKALYKASTLDKKYLKMAEESTTSLLKRLYMNNQLFHKKLDYRFPTQKALFEDYVFLVDLMLTAYQSTYKQEYLSLAQMLYKRTNLNYYINNQWYLTKDTKYPVSFNDRYYVAPIARHFHNGLTLANLTNDLEVLKTSKKIINEQKNKILHNLDKHPESLRALLRIQYGDIILKSNKKNLLKKTAQISKIKYPFLLTQTEDTKLFQACDETTCFSYNKNLNIVIQSIDK